MTPRTARLVTRLSLSLAAVAALAACEPAKDNNTTNNQPSDMALPDMPTPDMEVDQVPDLDPDMVVAQAKLTAVFAAGARNVNALAPAPLLLNLTFEGELPDGAMVEVLFGLPNVQRVMVPAGEQVMVTPPADAAYRGAVPVSVRFGEDELALEGGLLYGLGLGGLEASTGVAVHKLAGIERVDEAWRVGQDLLFVQQRAHTGGAAPNALLATEAKLAAFREVNGGYEPVGEALAYGVEEPTIVNESLIRVSLAPPDAPNPGATRISAIRVMADKLVEEVLHEEQLAQGDRLRVTARGDALYSATIKAAGGITVKDVMTQDAYESDLLNQLDVASARFVELAGDDEGMPGVAMIGWARVNADKVEARLVLDVASASPRSLTLGTFESRATSLEPIDAAIIQRASQSRTQPGVTGLVYVLPASMGGDMLSGTLKHEQVADLSFVPVFKAKGVIGEQDGIDRTTFNSIMKRTNHSDCRRNKCIMSVCGTRKSAQPWVFTPPLTAEDANTLEIVRQGYADGEGATLLEVGPGRGGRGMSAVFGARVVDYTISLGDEPVRDTSGRLVAGADVIGGSALLQVKDKRLEVYTRQSAPTLDAPDGQGVRALRASTFGVVLALNNTKKTTLKLTPPADTEITPLGPVRVIEGADGTDDLVLVVGIRRVSTGGKLKGYFRIAGSALTTLDPDKPEAEVQGGLLVMPAGQDVRDIAGAGDTVYLIAGKTGAMGLHEATLKAAGGEQPAPKEIMSQAKLREDNGDMTLVFDALMFGDSDPNTEAPGIVALVAGGPYAMGKRMHKPFVITKELDRAAPPVTQPIENASDMVIVGGDLIFQDSSAFLLGFTGGDASAPVLIQMKGKDKPVKRMDYTWTDGGITSDDEWQSPNARLIGQWSFDDAAAQDTSARSFLSDVNQDGVIDVVVQRDGLAGSGSYDLILVGQPGGGFAPLANTGSAALMGVQPRKWRAADKCLESDKDSFCGVTHHF